jgi:hypothetical protein
MDGRTKNMPVKVAEKTREGRTRLGKEMYTKLTRELEDEGRPNGEGRKN